MTFYFHIVIESYFRLFDVVEKAIFPTSEDGLPISTFIKTVRRKKIVLYLYHTPPEQK